MTSDGLRVWLGRHGQMGSQLAMAACLLGLIAWTCWESPKYPQRTRFGDDVEYLLGAQSFVRHGTPDFRPGDDQAALAQLPRKWRGSAALKYQPPRPSGYFEARNGRLYSWHFWTYPAAVAPFTAVLEPYGLGARAFHYANVLYLCAALLTLAQLATRPRLWLTLLPLAFFTPVLWFLPLVHTEPFVFSLGLVSLACAMSERRVLAILFSSLAATQFQPLALISLYLCAESLWLYRGRYALMAACLACAALAFVPNVFYSWHFGTPSVVTREGYANSGLISFEKLASMFVDLDTGLLVYLPGVLLLWTLSLGSAAWRALQARSLGPLLLAASVVLALYISTSARIWNYHTQGISRYALYTVPALLLVIARELEALPRLRWPFAAAFAVALGLQALVHAEWGWFEYRGNNNLHHNRVALFVLERWPALYNPPPEIFCSRTVERRCWIDLDSGRVTDEYLPAILSDAADSPLKALVQPCKPEATLAARAWTPEQTAQIRAAAASCGSGAPRYLNFR
ncbi:MAG TPA: hypothetical protein VJV78_24830 [Polyangiales bacterium]|nr:hypothetical protein [Polyangiales bacterium]